MQLCVLFDPQCDAPLPTADTSVFVDGCVQLALQPGYIQGLRALSPDVVLVDLRRMGAVASASIVSAIVRAAPAVRVLAVGAPAAMGQAQATLAQGAWGYLTREINASELTRALRKLAAGGMYVTDTARRAMAESVRNTA